MVKKKSKKTTVKPDGLKLQNDSGAVAADIRVVNAPEETGLVINGTLFTTESARKIVDALAGMVRYLESL